MQALANIVQALCKIDANYAKVQTAILNPVDYAPEATVSTLHKDIQYFLATGLLKPHPALGTKWREDLAKAITEASH